MHISGIKERHAEGNRLRHSASVLLALAAALAVLLVGNVDVGQAQTAASLIEVQGGGTQIHFEGERALGFRTAASAGTGNDGWVVTEVELRIRPDDGTGANRTATPPGLEICEATNSGDPDPNGTCFPLTAPGTVQVPTAMTNGQEVTYTATGNGHFLATGTEYTLHFTENSSTNAGDVHYLDASNDDGEAVFVAGAFANVMRELRSDNTWGPSSTSVAWARITGYASTTPVNSVATGAPSITAPNVFRVPAALGVDLSGIVDTNGVAGIATTATYKWQRFAADGTTLETDSIGTDSTYTLTDADAGKTLKVVVSFRDDDNFAEGPLTSAATSAITAAATCDAPTLTGGAVFLGPARKLAVASYEFGGSIDRGFSRSHGAGSLDNVTFTTAAYNDYEIQILAATAHGGLVFTTATRLSAVDRMTVVLHVCDQAYALASGGNPSTDPAIYHFTTPAPNWSTYAERTIYLSQDTVAPTPVSATVNGTSLVMTFNEELGAAASIANSDFTVKKGSGGTTQTLSSTAPLISGSTVTLTLATAVSATDTNVKVSYTKPSTGTANKLLDKFGNEVATFTADQDVTNELEGSSQVLVSNIGQVSNDTPDSGDKAQPLRTGANPAGYTVKSIEMATGAFVNTSSFPAVTLRSGSATGTLVGTPAKPSSSPASGVLTYTFDTPVPLDASTTYWVVTGPTVSVSWWSAASDATDATTASGWTIPGKAQHKPGASFVDFAGNAYFKLRVNGTVTPPPPVLISNIGQVPEDTPNSADKAQPFRTGANPAGYTVKSIEMQTNAIDTTPAAYPAVTLRSGSATGTLVGTPAKPSGSSVSGILTYTFDTTVPLAASTTYWVVTGSATTTLQWYVFGSDATDAATASGWTIPGKAQDKSGASFVDFADNAYFQISVRGVRSNSATTGAPSITAPNVFRVPAALGVDLSGITDTNGVTRIATTATYKWQRFGADGTTLETDSIGTRSTYTLTDADAAKTLKVVVSFRDDDGHPEGPLTSVATAAITPAASCVVPTLVGGAVFLGPARKVGVEKSVLGTLTQYGFAKSLGVGSLDNATFTTTASNDYEIVYILTDSGQMNIAFDKDLTAVDKNTLVLHVCDQAYAFGPTAAPASSSYRFAATFGVADQIWRDYAERTIYLSQDIAAPTFVEAMVNGTSLVITFNEELGAAASLANSDFTVKKGSGGTTQTLSGSPSISGRTVTLTLDTAVSATDTDVKVSYTKPSTGTANKLLDTFGNEVATFTADQDVGNQLADNTPPELVSSNAAVLARDGLTLTLTFNEALKTSSVPAVAAFTVEATPAGGIEAEVALASSGGVTVSGSTVVLKLGIQIAHNDTAVKVRYEKPTSGTVIEDTNGNDAAGFNRPVTNNSVIPRVNIVRVHDDASPGIAHAEFKVTRSNTSTSALALTIEITQDATYLASTTHTITIPANATSKTEKFESYYEGNTAGDLTATVAESGEHLPSLGPNNAATVRMKVPTSGRTLTISHQQGNYLVTEGDGTVSIGATLTTGDASAEPRETVSLLIDTTDGTAKSGNPSDFVQVAGQIVNVQPGNWTASGTAYTATSSALILIENDNEYEGSEQFNVIIGPDSTHAIFNLVCPPGIQASRGCLATVTITDDETLEVSDVEVTTTPTGGYYDFPGNIDFTATLNGKVNVTGSPEFAFELGGETRQAEYAMGASNTTELVFRYELTTGDGDDHDGISWGANALSLNGGTIKFMHTDAAQQVNANLNHAAQGALPGHKVDTTKPSLEEAEVDDTTLELIFSEELNTTAPASSAFTVKVDAGTGTNPTAVAIAGRVATLTLASGVGPEQTATVSYSKPSANPIKDLSGKEADSFTDHAVEFATDILNFSAAPGNRRVTLSWDNPNDSTINRYQYRFMNTSDSVWNPDWRNISGSGSGTTSFTATGLTNGIEYTFQVRPVTRQGGQDMPGKEAVNSVPRGSLAAPRNMAASSAGDGEIALIWDDPSDITITGYQYRYRNSSDSGWNPDWTDISGSGATTTSHKLSGLTNNLLYTLEVRALRDGTGGPSARATQKPRGPLAAPANFAAASGENRRVTLSWDNSGDDSITRYQYRYRISAESAWNPDWTDIPGSRWNTTSYTVTGLVNRTAYTFEARALRGTLEGPVSTGTATPEGPPTAPLPPTGLTVHEGHGNLGLSWEPPTIQDERAPVTGYRVRYREEGRNWRTVSRSDLSIQWQTITGLRNGLTYEVQVASVNRVGAGAWTSSRGTPQGELSKPPGPVGLKAFNVGSLNVWWLGTDPNGKHWGNLREMESCAGTYPFTVIWAGPEDDRSMEEWAAHFSALRGLVSVTHSFKRSPGNKEYYQMDGRVTMDGRTSMSIAVRGRNGDKWGSWSPISSLICLE